MVGRVDRYQLLELIGQGSFGGVYRARHVHTGQIVALKLARGGVDPEAAARILSEGRAAGRLDHPNVVGVLDGGVADTGETFVVMQLLEGYMLEQLLARSGPLDTARAIDLGIQMLAGLSAAHARGVIHRDVKPSNVFVTKAANGSELVKVIDFGISKLRAAGTTTSGPLPGVTGGPPVFTLPGVALGTPGYMAPEQLGDARSVDARADVYSVGATLYELLSGRKPIAVDGLESWMRKLRVEAAPPLASIAPMVPASTAAVIDRALARDRDARWPSAMAMRDALLGSMTFASAVTVTTRPSTGGVAPTLPMDGAAEVRIATSGALAPPPPPPMMMAPPRRPRRTHTRTSTAAWVFAAIGVVIAVLSIVALGLFLLLRARV
jgi:serine/threonine-protein kinase